MSDCPCSLCRVRKLKCHDWELYFGVDSLEAELVRKYEDRHRTDSSNHPIYWYSEKAKSIKYERKQAAIQKKAYELWELAGRPCGDGVDFWLEAESQLNDCPTNSNK